MGEQKCVRKTWILLGYLSGVARFEVSCMDINKVLEENPELILNYNALLYFHFFEKLFIKIIPEGETEEINMESMGESYKASPQYFFPGQGKFVFVDKLKTKNDEQSMTMLKYMLDHNLDTGFIDTIIGQMFSSVHLAKGDRFLKESEIKDFGQKQKITESEPESEIKEVKETKVEEPTEPEPGPPIKPEDLN